MDWRMTRDPMEILARYNAEVARGLVHADEWHAEMAQLQRWYDEERRDEMIERGMSEIADGVWMTTGKPTRPGFWRRLFRVPADTPE